MKDHPYVRAYMAGIAVPTPLLLIPLTVFVVARLVYGIPIPIERIIIFPMAIVPNLFGLWNVLHLASRSRTHLPLGIHGALLPFLLGPLGFLLGVSQGVFTATDHGLVKFGLITFHYVHIAIILPLVLVLYYLVWKYLVGFCNRVAGISQ
ncbi:MAG TPA: hypothetical protein VFU86_00310 [Terriglobales bacterium]|nr:hypothetical protein [Terriglobales bacterium]